MTATPPIPPSLNKTISVDFNSLIDTRKDLDTSKWCYKLTGNSYGLDTTIMSDADINESEMSMTILYADGQRRDGVGDLLEIGGINTERHRALPNVLFDHGKQCVLPIAMAEDPATGLYTNLIDPISKKASVRAYFYQGGSRNQSTKWEPSETAVKSLSDRGREYDHSVFCSQIFDLAAKRFLRGGSIGYQVTRANKLMPDYERGTPEGMHLLNTLMLEASLVVMPANMDTVTQKSLNMSPSIELAREVLAMPLVCGKALSPYLVKSFSPLAAQNTKVTVGGFYNKTITADGIKSMKDKSWLKDPRADYGEKEEIEGAGSKSVNWNSTVEVPLKELPNTQIPPSKWKPGVGASNSHVKNLRSKYKKSAADYGERIGAVVGSTAANFVGGGNVAKYVGDKIGKKVGRSTGGKVDNKINSYRKKGVGPHGEDTRMINKDEMDRLDHEDGVRAIEDIKRGSNYGPNRNITQQKLDTAYNRMQASSPQKPARLLNGVKPTNNQSTARPKKVISNTQPVDKFTQSSDTGVQTRLARTGDQTQNLKAPKFAQARKTMPDSDEKGVVNNVVRGVRNAYRGMTGQPKLPTVDSKPGYQANRAALQKESAAGTQSGSSGRGVREAAAQRMGAKPGSRSGQKAMSYLNNSTGGALVGSKPICPECKKLNKTCGKCDIKSVGVVETDNLHKSGPSPKPNKIGKIGSATGSGLGQNKPTTPASRLNRTVGATNQPAKTPNTGKVNVSNPTGSGFKKSEKALRTGITRSGLQKNLRSKWRKADKNLRRKRGNSATMRIREKDFGKVRDMAKSKGCSCEHKGIKDGFVHIKMTGDSSAMDDVAKSFGVAQRVFGKKSLPNTYRKSDDDGSLKIDTRKVASEELDNQMGKLQADQANRRQQREHQANTSEKPKPKPVERKEVDYTAYDTDPNVSPRPAAKKTTVKPSVTKSLPAQELRLGDLPSTLPDGREELSLGGMSDDILRARGIIDGIRDLKRGGGGKQTKPIKVKNMKSGKKAAERANDWKTNRVNTVLVSNDPKYRDVDGPFKAGKPATKKPKASKTQLKKSFENEDIKNMKRGNKALPPDMADAVPEIDEDSGIGDMGMEGDMGNDMGMEGDMGQEDQIEKYSAQVLRRLHRDNILLLEQYDEIAELLEHDDIGNHLNNKLQGLSAELDEIEAMFEKHHPGSAPLDGVGDDEMGMEDDMGDVGDMGDEDIVDDEMVDDEMPMEGEDEMMDEGMEEESDELPPEEMDEEIDEVKESVPEDEQEAEMADSDEEELPTPDEVAQGMQTKDLRRRLVKSLRSQYSKSASACGECGKTPCGCAKTKFHKDMEDTGEIEEETKDLDPSISEETSESTTEHEMPDNAGEVNHLQDVAEEAFGPLPSHHHGFVRDAGELCGKLSKTDDLDKETIMNAFRHGSNIGDIGGKLNSEVPDDFNMKHMKDLLTGFSPNKMLSKAFYDNLCKKFSQPESIDGAINAVNVTDPSGYNPKLGDEPAQQYEADRLGKVKGLEDEDFTDNRSNKHHYDAIKSASSFLKKVALGDIGKAWGEKGRQEALVNHLALKDAERALDPMLHSGSDVSISIEGSDEDDDGDVDSLEIGDVGEKSSTSLVEKPKKKFKEADKLINEFEINHPKSSKLKPGSDAAIQKFGKKEEKSGLNKQGKGAVGTGLRTAAATYGAGGSAGDAVRTGLVAGGTRAVTGSSTAAAAAAGASSGGGVARRLAAGHAAYNADDNDNDTSSPKIGGVLTGKSGVKKGKGIIGKVGGAVAGGIAGTMAGGPVGGMVGGALGGEAGDSLTGKSINQKTINTSALRQKFLRQNEQMSEIDKQIKQLTELVSGKQQ